MFICHSHLLLFLPHEALLHRGHSRLFPYHSDLLLCHSHSPSVIPTKVGSQYFFTPKDRSFSYYPSANSKNPPIPILEKGHVKYEDSYI